jgi:hypothetical protein
MIVSLAFLSQLLYIFIKPTRARSTSLVHPEHLAILKQGIEAGNICGKSEFKSIRADRVAIEKGG